MKSIIKSTLFLFFCLVLNSSIFTMNSKRNDNSFNQVWSGLCCGFMALDIFSGAKGSCVRGAAAGLALVVAPQLDKVIQKKYDLRNFDKVEVGVLITLVSLYSVQLGNSFNQYLDGNTTTTNSLDAKKNE